MLPLQLQKKNNVVTSPLLKKTITASQVMYFSSILVIRNMNIFIR